jgi:hypothetical protein
VGEAARFSAVRGDIGGDPENPDLSIAWKYTYTAKDTCLGPQQFLGSIGAIYNLTMDPYEKYDMTLCVHSFKRRRCIDPASGYYRVAEARTIMHYYCTLSLPLINPSHNVQKGDIYLVPGLLAG